MSPHRIRKSISFVDLPTYDISRNGFLPSREPLQQLSDQYYLPWEYLAGSIPQAIDGGTIFAKVDELPLLSTSFLRTECELRRAYVVLAFITQAYIWGGTFPSQSLPPALSVPFLRVSEMLGLPPVATFAALNLWNWKTIQPGLDICEPSNLQALNTLTATVDEEWFYMISIAIEARAAPVIPLMLQAMQDAQDDDSDQVMYALREFSGVVDSLSVLVGRMHERCDPQIFYDKVRPLLAGSRNMETLGLPRGVFFDTGDGSGQWRSYRGGSNGQSSLIHFLDTVLGIEHAGSASGHGFHKEMRSYMPSLHAAFLQDVDAIANLREFVERSSSEQQLKAAFNCAVSSLSAFRDSHLQLVSRYIIIPSRRSKNKASQRLNVTAPTEASLWSSVDQLKGTGGTKLMPFLKQSRSETAAAMI